MIMPRPSLKTKPLLHLPFPPPYHPHVVVLPPAPLFLSSSFSKVRCDKVMPCSRCVRLNLDCRPQTRGVRGRPLKHHTTRTAASNAGKDTQDSGEVAAVPPTQCSGGGGGSSSMSALMNAQRQQQRSRPSSSASASSIGSQQEAADMELYRWAASVMAKTFPKMSNEGRVYQPRAACKLVSSSSGSM